MTTAIHMKAQKRHVASWGSYPIILGVHFISQFDPHHLKRGHRDIILCFVLVFWLGIFKPFLWSSCKYIHGHMIVSSSDAVFM